MGFAQGAVSITTDGDVTRLVSPYNAELPARARQLGGRWEAATKSWRFDARDEDRVRELAIDIFGTDGGGDPTDVVTIRVPAVGAAQSLVIAGRTIAERPSRDQPVRLAPGVVIVEGSFPSRGGSVRNPLFGGNDVILEVRDIPRDAAERGGYTIVDAAMSRRETLQGERERLQERIEQIDTELAALDTE